MSDTRIFGAGPEQRTVTTHDVEVKAVANGNSIDWEVDGKRPDRARLRFEPDSGGHEIRFDLDADRTLRQRGLRFNSADPIYVHDRTDHCPRSGIDEQIEVLSCDGDTLKIYDKNSGAPKLLRYQLNFVENDGSQPVCDPIIDNGGTTNR